MKTAFLATLLATHAAFANPTNQASIDQARVYFERGKSLYDAGDYKRAVEEYLAAYKLAAFPELVFNIGQAYRLSGNASEALKMYELFLQQQPAGALADEARGHVIELRTKVATAEPPKDDKWGDFNKNLKLDRSGELDLRPQYAFGVRGAIIHNGTLFAAHASYIKHVGSRIALAPRAQLGMSFVRTGAFETETTETGPAIEIQARVLFVLSRHVYLGTGLSLGYVARAYDDEVSSEMPFGGVGGSFGYPVFAEVGVVFGDRFDLAAQLLPIALIDADKLAEGDQAITLALSYRMR